MARERKRNKEGGAMKKNPARAPGTASSLRRATRLGIYPGARLIDALQRGDSP